MKKKTAANVTRLELQSGAFVGIDARGNVVAVRDDNADFATPGRVLVTATELDQIAGIARELPAMDKRIDAFNKQIVNLEQRRADLQAKRANRLRRTASGHDVAYWADYVAFGCQQIPHKLLFAGLKLSQARRPKAKNQKRAK